jgi:probable phosphoglycerate mutase
MTLLLLLRHALTEATGRRLSGNAPGHHLSSTGRLQAEALASRLAPLRLAAVYASPLERCVETAEAVAGGRGLTVRVEPDIREVEYGRWTGRPLAQLARTSLWKRLQQQPSGVRFPEGESLDEVQGRAVRALDAIAARHPRGIVAAVTHADVIRLALAHYSGIHLDLYQRLIVSPASVTAIALGDRVPRIVRTNDTGTLDDLVQRSRRPVASAASARRT